MIGAQGRLLSWHPPALQSKRKALPAYFPELLCRFCKVRGQTNLGTHPISSTYCGGVGGEESSLQKREMFPDVDHMDIPARQERAT